ncbi:DNA primase [Clostridium haemolyticum]|uniref:DNA primase n=1 Tax=Clostridium haemolyticum TaxID=84025 RepID=UPI001C3AB3B4|nr:DNA primase [Clostridium haemolyticum]CAG7840053.1 DNA primase [Clostridium haemolyticum]
MLAYELKKYIIEKDKIMNILESIECHGIKTYPKEYRCGLPKHSNTTSVAIKKDTLKVKIFTSDKKINGDIFTLVMEIKKYEFPQAVKYLHEILGLKYIFNIQDIKKEEKKDILDVFKKAMQKKHFNNDIDELKIYNEDICREIIQIPYIGWIREGIMPFTQERFNIGYSRDKNRIAIPHRFWCGKENEYVGVMGRTLVKNYDLLDIPKYFPLKAFPKSMNLYGLQENYKYIQKANKIIVFEAEKSVLKAHSFLCRLGVALGGHELCPEQIRILLGLDVEIIFAMDNDMDEQLSINMCNQVKSFRRTSYIYDKWGLLGEKDSPVDKGMKVFKALYNNRIKIV